MPLNADIQWLKAKIFNDVQQALQEFEKNTGMTPSDIRLNFMSVGSISNEDNRHILTSVEVRFQL